MSESPEYVFELNASPITGAESQMFCDNLLRAYMSWCERQRYRMQLVTLQGSEWGTKQAIALVEGDCTALETHAGLFRLLAESPLDPTPRRIHAHTAQVRWYPSSLDDIAVKFERLGVGAGGAVERLHCLRAVAPTSEVTLTQVQGQSWAELEAIARRILAGRLRQPRLAFSEQQTFLCRLHPVAQFYARLNLQGKTINLSRAGLAAFWQGEFPTD